METHARVVVIGGGVTGCAILYHLAKAGKAAEADIAAGKIVVFKGPIKDQTGGDKVASGAVLDDGAIAGMDWLADGVEGQLPK